MLTTDVNGEASYAVPGTTAASNGQSPDSVLMDLLIILLIIIGMIAAMYYLTKEVPKLVRDAFTAIRGKFKGHRTRVR